jgi:hypothetical protein
MKNFTLGIYPGGLVGTETGMSTGYPNDPAKIQYALDELQGDARYLGIRAYAGYHKKGGTGFTNPENPERYLKPGRKLDLVLCFQSEDEEMSGWLDFIGENIDQYAGMIECLQITEEANVNLPSLDGYYRNSRMALVEGVIAAKDCIIKKGLDIKVGFNATPDFNSDKAFWKEIAALATPVFYNSLDYVGLDFFPDVFRQIVIDDNLDALRNGIHFLLNHFKNIDLAAAGISNQIPVHVTENGWPTGLGRAYEKQAIILNEIVRTIFACRAGFNIAKYELFDLRDADSDNDDLFYQFGIMRHDYTPKPAFEVYKLLIKELTIYPELG